MAEYQVSSHQKVTTNADLSEAFVDHALQVFAENYMPEATMLVAPVSDAYIAGRICGKFGLEFVAIPDEIMERDSWMICNKYTGVWSPGA